MFKERFSIVFVSLILAACGGGGGGSEPLSVTINSTNMITTDEDVIYQGNIAATSNKPSTKTYVLTISPANGSVEINQSGNITYTPDQDWHGSDSFSYRVTATIASGDSSQPSESAQASGSVSLSVNSVNDPPVFSITDLTTIGSSDSSNLILEDNISIEVSYSDVDNPNSDLSSYVSVQGVEVTSTLQTNTIDIDLSQLTSGGLLSPEVCVEDLSDRTCDSFQSWLVSNKTIVPISYTDSSDVASSADYYVYYLLGSPNSTNGTQYLFVGDLLSDSDDLDSFRESLISSVNTILDSDAGGFIDGYFNIVVAEPVTPDGTSPANVRTGCYDWDTSVFCIGSSELDMNVFDQMLSNYDLLSILTTVQGRGVNLGNRNIQSIKPTTNATLMHELGHAHGEMGDEYLTSDDRDVSYWADLNVNTTTETDPNNLKWNHWIENITHVPGVNYDVCYNYSDGDVFDSGLTLADCECLWNKNYTYPPEDMSTNPETDENCHKKVGLFEGNYYGAEDNYRPKYWTIMEGGIFEYGEVNVEGFAVGSIQNQGFTNFTGNPVNTINGGNTISFSLDVDFNSTKIRIKWFEDGVEDTTKRNMRQVSFSRPLDNGVVVYAWKAEDLTGAVIAQDDPDNPDDFYEGLFNSSYYWISDDNSTSYSKPSDLSGYQYGYMFGPLGNTFAVNWSKFPENTAASPFVEMNLERGLSKESISEKVFRFNGNKDDLNLKSVVSKGSKSRISRSIPVTKRDKYVLEFFDSENKLIYTQGIGNPFYVHFQHIGYEDSPVMGMPIEVENLEISVPDYVNPSSIKLLKRSLDGYKEIKNIVIN